MLVVTRYVHPKYVYWVKEEPESGSTLGLRTKNLKACPVAPATLPRKYIDVRDTCYLPKE